MRTIKSMNQSLASDSKKLNIPALPLNVFRLQAVRLVQNYCQQLGVSYRQIKLRSLRSRWGSCTRVGVITLNLKLKDLPPEFLEYVAYHECLHLIHKNHGPEFQAALRTKFPQARQLNKALQIYGSHILTK